MRAIPDAAEVIIRASGAVDQGRSIKLASSPVVRIEDALIDQRNTVVPRAT